MEELIKQANAVLPAIIDRLAKAEDFVIEQAPLVIQELLTWNFVISLLWHIVGWVLLSTIFLYSKKLWEFRGEEELESKGTAQEGFATVLTIIVYVAHVFFSSLFIFSNLDWLKIWIAPRVWLIEYAAELAK